MDKKTVNKIFDFVSLIKYNGEKRDYIEKTLKKFLLNPEENFEIEKEIKSVFEKRDLTDKEGFKREMGNFFSPDELFEMQDYLLTIDANPSDLIYYISEKYNPYNAKLKKEIGVGVSDIIRFSIALGNIYQIDLNAQGYKHNPNIFSSKEDAFYPHNLQYPDSVSKEISKMASLLDKKALILFLEESKMLPEVKTIIENLDLLLNLISFTSEELKKDPKIRFQDKPLLKLDEETYVIINEVHLLFGLQSRLENLLNKYTWYSDKKGKTFEKIVFNILEQINKDKRIDGNFFNNINYKIENASYELDGLINFKDFSWFLECKSRIPRPSSYKGDIKSVKKDVTKGITDADYQSQRAIKESEKKGRIGDKEVKEHKGVLIITEGLYPNMNMNPMSVFPKKHSYPRYIINLLTLMEILRQRDVYYLEKFLKWRCDPKMPLYCFSELDYWDYFTRMQEGLDKKESYDLAIRNNNKIFFNGRRFNAPKYIKD